MIKLMANGYEIEIRARRVDDNAIPNETDSAKLMLDLAVMASKAMEYNSQRGYKYDEAECYEYWQAFRNEYYKRMDEK